jgi:hypothetical protein
MDFMRKTSLVAGGHVRQPPSVLMYASMVTWETVRTTSVIAALNDMSVLGADIFSTYLNAPTIEKVHVDYPGSWMGIWCRWKSYYPMDFVWVEIIGCCIQQELPGILPWIAWFLDVALQTWMCGYE